MDETIRNLLAGYVDGELSDDERNRFEQALAENPELKREVNEFRNLKEVTNMATYADLPDEVWAGYWQSVYRKTERGIGWLLFSVGAIILLLFTSYQALTELFVDPNAPLWLKIGVSALTAGAVFLLVSFGRERIFAFNRDRYKEVNK